jgi:hypothetical protein
VSHAEQLPPLMPGAPQAMKLVWLGSHAVADEQQPPQPLDALHTQVAVAPLPLQVVPFGQAAPVDPHTQLPLVHRLALVGSHVLQVPGAAPQLLVSIVLWQAPAASQQPLGHEVASHTQPPLTQRWPAAQALPPGPHEQEVPTQRSALAPHATQAAPPEAQPVAGPLAVQVLPVQQVLQVMAQPVHAPPTHESPELHVTHALPAVPQLVGSVAVMQLLPRSQQPLPHEVASHTHMPPRQRWPPLQGALLPHLHAPPEQLSAVMPHEPVQVPPAGPQLPVPMVTQPLPLLHELGSQTQPLVESQIWLTPHCEPLQSHTPAVQVSLLALQSRQVPPF